MIKYKANCKVCQAIKKDKKLMQRIYDSSYYIPHSQDSLANIHRDCEKLNPKGFSYLALTNHVKKHQHLNASDYEKKMLKIESEKAEMQILQDRFDAQQVQDSIMNVGMDLLNKGEIKITADHMLRATKDKQDALAKKADQQLQLASMVAFFASAADKQGEDKIHDRRVITIEDYDPSIPVTEHLDSRP